MDNKSNQNSSAPLPKNAHRFHYAWIIFIGCCFLQAGGIGVIMYTIGVFTVPVCNELGFARSEFALWISAHAIASIFSYPIIGKLYTKYDFRIVLSVATIVTALAAFLMSTYTEVWQFVCSGVIYGTFGMAVLALPQAVLITNWFQKWSGKAMGFSACAGSLFGAAFAPFLEMIIETTGWRAAYLVQGGTILLFILPFSLFLFRLKPSEMGLLPYGYSEDGEAKKSKAKVVNSGVSVKIALTSMAFIMILIFIGSQNIVASGYDAHIAGIGISCGLTASVSALLVSALQLGSSCGKFGFGFVSDWIGAKKATYAIIAGITLGLIGMIAFRNPYFLFVSVFFFGFQDTLGSVAAPIILKEIFGELDYVSLFAWMRVAFGIFGAVAAPLVGLVYDITGTYDLALCMGLGLCALIFVSLALAYKFGKKLEWKTEQN